MRKSPIFYLPVIGLIVGMIRHGRACKAHKKACDLYWKQNDPCAYAATWQAFHRVFEELDNAALGLLSFIAGVVIILFLLLAIKG